MVPVMTALLRMRGNYIILLQQIKTAKDQHQEEAGENAGDADGGEAPHGCWTVGEEVRIGDFS